LGGFPQGVDQAVASAYGKSGVVVVLPAVLGALDGVWRKVEDCATRRLDGEHADAHCRFKFIEIREIERYGGHQQTDRDFAL
jgi:hypothetical protein